MESDVIGRLVHTAPSAGNGGHHGEIPGRRISISVNITLADRRDQALNRRVTAHWSRAMSFFPKLLSVDHLLMAAAAAHPEAPPALPVMDLCHPTPGFAAVSDRGLQGRR
jgi:hypothetical protein